MVAVRKSGIGAVGDIAWGTHFCQFYHTREDLIDILVPYFKAGLENNEYCLWITANPLGEREAERAMREAVPDFYRLYQGPGQIEMVPYSVWYLKDGSFNLSGLLSGRVHKATQALSKGYDGVRVTVNVAWLDKKTWNKFVSYEEEENSSMNGHPILSLCSYPLAKCGSSEIIDVVRNHQFALVRRGFEWGLVGGSGHEKTRRGHPGSEYAYRALFEGALDGMFVIDAETMRVVLANETAAKMFGMDSAEDAVGITPLDFISQDDRNRAVKIIAEDMFGEDLRQVN